MNSFHTQYGKTPVKTSKVSSLYIKLRSRFTRNYFLMVLLPCLLIVSAATIHIRSMAQDWARKAALDSIEQDMSSIENKIDEIIPAVAAIQKAMETAAHKGFDVYTVPEIKSMLQQNAETCLTPGQLSALAGVYLIIGDEIRASFGTNAATAVLTGPTTQEWYVQTLQNTRRAKVIGTMQRFYREGKSRMVFSMSSSARYSDERNSPAVLLFDFDYSLIENPASSAHRDIYPYRERLILDQSGNILYSRYKGSLTTAADHTVQEAVASGSRGFATIHLNSRNYYLTYIKYPELGWVYIDLNPVSNVTENLWLRSPILILCIVAWAIPLLVYPAVSLKLLSPINELTTVISDYENQFPVAATRNPPVHDLPRAGMSGISDIDYLIDKIYSIRLRQKEAELNALQNQINPHFLYNTLESIRGAALYHGIQEIASMSKALSLLFRYSISERVLVSIKEEMQHLENYISIQNFRYENKFELQYSIPPELMHYRILKLTLQPLIENSIKHGLEMKIGRGTVKIEILSLESNIKILISDNGLGITPKKVEELNRMLIHERNLDENETDKSATGIGVRNVNSRIKLYFGEQYGLKFRDTPTGTTVEITLPAVMENGGDT